MFLSTRPYISGVRALFKPTLASLFTITVTQSTTTAALSIAMSCSSSDAAHSVHDPRCCTLPECRQINPAICGWKQSREPLPRWMLVYSRCLNALVIQQGVQGVGGRSGFFRMRCDFGLEVFYCLCLLRNLMLFYNVSPVFYHMLNIYKIIKKSLVIFLSVSELYTVIELIFAHSAITNKS